MIGELDSYFEDLLDEEEDSRSSVEEESDDQDSDPG